MSIESDILREIDFTAIINDFAEQNRDKCLAFEFRLCVERYNYNVFFEASAIHDLSHDCVERYLVQPC